MSFVLVTKRRLNLLFFVAISCISYSILTGCGTTAKNVYTPREWCNLFKQAGDWVPLPYPESAYRPGSIIEVTDNVTRWIDHLESCKYPDEALMYEKSTIPKLTFTKAMKLGGNAFINLKGITAGPKFDRISKIHLEVRDHGVDYLKLLHLRVWMQKPENLENVSSICMDELKKPDMYLVTEAFRVSKGTYTLFDEKEAAIKLSVPALGDLLKFEPGVNYNVEADGKLTIEEPVYFAVRRVVRVGEDFETRGLDLPEPEPADAKIEKLFFRAAGVK